MAILSPFKVSDNSRHLWMLCGKYSSQISSFSTLILLRRISFIFLYSYSSIIYIHYCLFVHCNAKLINLWETEVSLSYFYTLLVDFPLMGASRPKGLYVFRYRLLSYTNTWDCSSMLNLRYSALTDIIQCISIYQTLNKARIVLYGVLSCFLAVSTTE